MPDAALLADDVSVQRRTRPVGVNNKPYNAESQHVHVYRLRNKLAPYAIQIETMVNVGYRLLLDTEDIAGRKTQPCAKSA
ncbi:MAG TPA: hypothetical protein VF666_10700 [Pyrinomonadaceae bacterium]